MIIAAVLIGVCIVIAVAVTLVVKNKIRVITAICGFSSIIAFICSIILVQIAVSRDSIEPTFDNIALAATILVAILVPISVSIAALCLEATDCIDIHKCTESNELYTSCRKCV